jgi:DNA-binding transcriptional MerR regulator
VQVTDDHATGAVDLSVDELAERTGATVRTIRYYQSEGLLPAPTRRGRQVRYGVEHLERMRLIAELQERGLRLTAIADLLRHTPDDASAADWLGLGETLSRPWSEDHPALLDEDELHERLAGTPAGTADDLVRTGVVERRADTRPVVYFVPSPGMLEVAIALVRLGVDLEVGARLRDLLQRRLRATAQDLVAQFTAEVSVAHLAEAGPGALAVLLDQLRPLTRRTVDLLFAHEMERAQRELLEAASETPPITEKGSPR